MNNIPSLEALRFHFAVKILGVPLLQSHVSSLHNTRRVCAHAVPHLVTVKNEFAPKTVKAK